MKRHALFVATALLVVTGAAAAQSSAPGHSGRMQIDADADGVITRAEAARAPRLAAKFAELDKDGDGRLTAAERPRHHGKRGGHEGHRGGGIERFDADGDGRISRAEFDQGMAAKQAARSGRGHGPAMGMQFDFAAADANGDGYLVRTELGRWHERQRPQREAAMAKRFDAKFVAADLNRDGKLSRVEVDEKMPRLAGRFAWMDDNRDGFLSRAELKPARGR